MIVLEIVFWVAAGLLVFAQVGYPLLLAAWTALGGRGGEPVPPAAGDEPFVAFVVAAHREAPVIAARVANVRELDWPADRLQLIVACDGSPDETVARAREAGADLVLDLPWGGKVRAQDAAVQAADPRATLIAFSDANASWEPQALRELAAALVDPGTGYACGSVTFTGEDGATNQEGLYWRYEMWIRSMESRLASVTGGNGAIYAVRREDYIEVDPVMGHDLSFPFNFVKRGRRAVYVPAARAREKMVPTVEGEFARKRRMMSHAWPIVLRGGLASPAGYPPRYALMVASHRLLRYASPFLHLVALAANVALVAAGAGTLYVVTLAVQAAVLALALLGAVVPARPFLVARYYVLTTASIAAGLWDHLRHGTPAGWAPPEGTR